MQLRTLLHSIFFFCANPTIVVYICMYTISRVHMLDASTEGIGHGTYCTKWIHNLSGKVTVILIYVGLHQYHDIRRLASVP